MLPESWRAALSPDQQEWIGRTSPCRSTTSLPHPRPLLRLSAVPLDASQDLASTADLAPSLRATWSMTKAGLYRTIRRAWTSTAGLSCDPKLLPQLRSPHSGQQCDPAVQHGCGATHDSWMRRSVPYLGVCEQFPWPRLCVQAVLRPPPPPMPNLYRHQYGLLTVYGYDVVTRLEEYKARITSTFGSILKMDSTKKV
ncbi:hypothetical protein CRENBAI_013629 [Crenichthys baileyi]|uniref:DUF6729 domain-containing protein n=1 Tax=Crenichthys baileyi TaxID=28760 RepID=A0AAV9RLX7_9TELE